MPFTSCTLRSWTPLLVVVAGACSVPTRVPPAWADPPKFPNLKAAASSPPKSHPPSSMARRVASSSMTMTARAVENSMPRPRAMPKWEVKTSRPVAFSTTIP